MRILIAAMMAVVVLVALAPAALAQEVIALTEPVSYINTILIIALPIMAAWVLERVGKWLDERKLVSEEIKAMAMVHLERMADDAIDAGTTALAKYAKELKVTVANPHVAAIAGYIVHQGPTLLRQAGMTEEHVAGWITRRLAVVPQEKVAPPTPGLAAAVKAVSDPIDAILHEGIGTAINQLRPAVDASGAPIGRAPGSI